MTLGFTETVPGPCTVYSLVSGEKTPHQWTPSRMRGRGAVKPRWEKRSERRGSTGQSPAALCPTNVQQLWVNRVRVQRRKSLAGSYVKQRSNKAHFVQLLHNKGVIHIKIMETESPVIPAVLLLQ